MDTTDADFNFISFPGSMKAGLYTAQLGVSLAASHETITLTSPGHSFCLEREHLVGLMDTSLLGLFKRGIRFIHRQPGVPATIVFYPAVSRDHVRQRLKELGWS